MSMPIWIFDHLFQLWHVWYFAIYCVLSTWHNSIWRHFFEKSIFAIFLLTFFSRETLFTFWNWDNTLNSSFKKTRQKIRQKCKIFTIFSLICHSSTKLRIKNIQFNVFLLFLQFFVYIICRGRSNRWLCFDFGTFFSDFFFCSLSALKHSRKRFSVVRLINIPDFCSSMSASGSHRARKRIREAKKKARPGKQKIPPQKIPTPIFWLSWIFLEFCAKIGRYSWIF